MKKNSSSEISNPKSLRTLMVDNSENDVLLIVRELKKGGYNPSYERVETAISMEKVLKDKQWDVILCDYKMPTFNAPSAIALLKKTDIDIPLIIVSGSIGEDVAVECMRLGAQDYIMKGNLSRLCPAIARELEEAEVRNKQKQAESQRKAALEELLESKKQYKSLYGLLRLMCDNVPDMIWAKDLSKRYLFANKAMCENLLCAKDTEEPIGKSDMYFAERERCAHPNQPDWATFGEICTDSDSVVMSTKQAERFDEFGKVKGQFLYLDIHKAPFWDEQGNMIGTVGCGRDVTREKQLEQERQEAEEKYRNIFDNSSEGLYQVSPEGYFITANPAAARTLGYESPEELINTVTNIGSQVYVCTEDRKKALELLRKDGSFKNFEVRNRQKNGNIVWVMASVHIVRDEQGNNLYHEGTSQDITERKHAESQREAALEALRLSEENFRRSLENLPLGVRIVTIEGETIYANQAILDIYGYDSIEELKTTLVENRYTPESFAEYQIRREKRKRGDDAPSEYDIGIVRKDGEVRHLHVFRKDILWNGERQFQVLYNDITDRKQAEERFHASLGEKDILLREIHHRVKNNMQVISSLLDLPASLSGNQERRKMFHESQSRIHAMSLVHEKLYGSKDFARIDLAGYVRTLSQDLFQSYKINPGKIDLIIQTDGDVYVDINKAIPCGLILNELISNALKHAFPGNSHGELQVIIRKTKNTEIEIVVRDDGLGLSGDVDVHEPRSVGLHLVNGLVKNQLDGQIEFVRAAGTEIHMKFPL
jgi:PAS domain S-box-containing protein